MAEKTIAELLELRSVGNLMLPEGFHPVSETSMPAPELIVGVELEIENLIADRNIDGFRFVADGSLRNHGVEAVSNPIPTKCLEPLLKKFVNTYRLTDANYSERCSTHVHVNVQDMTWNQVKLVCMIYQMFERLLFNYVQPDRKDNIFCVPWYESGLSPRFLEKMQRNAHGETRQWVKYSALNLIPISTQGTLEFRHLHGTCDVPLIMGWVRLLSRIFNYSKTTTIAKLTQVVLDMNTVSNYDAFLSDVFGEDRFLLMTHPNYQADLSVGVVDTKLMFLKKPEKAGDLTISPELAAALEAHQARPRPAPRIMRQRDAVAAAAPQNVAAHNWIVQADNMPNPFAGIGLNEPILEFNEVPAAEGNW